MERAGADHLSDADLIAHLDGTSTGERRQRIDAHLAGCPDCRRRIEEFKEVGRLLRERYPLVDDPEARARIVARSLELAAEQAADTPGQAADAERRFTEAVRHVLTRVRRNRRDN